VPVYALEIENFKGIQDRTTLPIRPLTLFIGPNSSGKSSGIHALAAMAQTVKLGASGRSLVLDDEFAQVHLGRFIEVVHSRKYTDAITIGIDIGEQQFATKTGKAPVVFSQGNARATYSFRCVSRTQEMRLDSAEFIAGPTTYTLKPGRARSAYDLTNNQLAIKHAYDRDLGFSLSARLPTSARTRPDPYAFTPFRQLQRALLDELRKTLYLGPFRQAPQRRYPTRGSNPSEVGAQGEATTTLLANEMTRSRRRVHIKQVSTWLAMLGLGKSLGVTRLGKSDLFDVNVTLPKEGSAFPIADLGYGLSQVLPVLTQCSFAPEGATLLFEQPELHLHQLASRPLMRVFIDTIKEKGVHIVAETHSPELFGQLQVELRRKSIKLTDVAVYRVSRAEGKSLFKAIAIDPEDFDVYELWEDGLTKELYSARTP
jgi:predicted ATPase